VIKTAEYCRNFLPDFNWNLTLSYNGKNPGKIFALYINLVKDIPELKYKYTEMSGKGAGIKNAWLSSSANYLIYMDIDLSTDLKSLRRLLLNLDKADIVVGSRFHSKSILEREFKRKFISTVYHKVFHNFFLLTKYKDAHCGFKGVKKDVAKKLLPYVKDNGFFFDSEFMYKAEKLGFKILSIPVKWYESSEVSSVSLQRIIPSFILKIIKLKLSPIQTLKL
jgi:hypothetical protein